MDDVIRKYDKTAEEYALSRIGTEDREELETMRGLLQPQATILDVGCAAGRDTRIFKDMGLDVIGSDLSKKLLDIAKVGSPDIDFVIADMRDLPFADKTFDAVWASAVLHHVSKQDMVKAVSEFERVLALGGILYVHTKAGSGVLRTNEATVSGEEREFELVIKEELHTMLVKHGFSKLSLNEVGSKSRPGLKWINAFYKKSG